MHLGLPKAPPQRDSQRQGNQCLCFTWQLQLCLTLHHWLAAQERQQLKERERAIAEAEQARRKSVRVTFDLLGRQVRASWRGGLHLLALPLSALCLA